MSAREGDILKVVVRKITEPYKTFPYPREYWHIYDPERDFSGMAARYFVSGPCQRSDGIIFEDGSVFCSNKVPPASLRIGTSFRNATGLSPCLLRKWKTCRRNFHTIFCVAGNRLKRRITLFVVVILPVIYCKFSGMRPRQTGNHRSRVSRRQYASLRSTGTQNQNRVQKPLNS